MCAIRHSDDRRRTRETSPGITSPEAVRANNYRMRRRLASLSYAEGQEHLSPSNEGPTTRGAGQDPNPPEKDPENLDALTFDQTGTWWADRSLDYYEESDNEQPREPKWRTGLVVSNLENAVTPDNRWDISGHDMGSTEIDSEIEDNSYEITAQGNSSISGGVLTIHQEHLKPFHEGRPEIDDVLQGPTGDCYLLAALVAMANSSTGQKQLRSMIRPAGNGYMVEFFGLARNQSDQVDVEKGAKLKVHVSLMRSSAGVALHRNGPHAVQLEPEDEHELIRQHGGRPENKSHGFFGRLKKLTRRLFSRTPGVHTVDMTETTVVLWPWIIEKAYAIIGGGYSTIGEGGFTILPKLLLMGADSTAVQTELRDDRNLVTEDMNEEEAFLLFQEVQHRINSGGLVTASTRSSGDMRRRGPMDNTWLVESANARGIKIESESETRGWSSLEQSLDPFIQVETGEGTFQSVDPSKISTADRALIISAVADGRIVEVKSKARLHHDGLNLVPNHAYAVLAASSKGILLHNPWGQFQPGRAIRPNEFADCCSRIYMSEQG